MDNDLIPYTQAELEALRLIVLKGEILSLDTLKRIVFTRRKGYSAIPVEKKAKSRTSEKPGPTEEQLDFF
jgi:hypothetical protein